MRPALRLRLRFDVMRPSLLDDEEELELEVVDELEDDERDPSEDELLSEELLNGKKKEGNQKFQQFCDFILFFTCQYCLTQSHVV